jgi:hypothetical protein
VTADVGATPLQIALEANSAAHHALDEVRELRREVGLRHDDVRDLIAAVGKDIASMRGEVQGESRATRRWLKLALTLAPVAGAAAPHVLRALGWHT